MRSKLAIRDTLGTIKVRLGFGRNSYKVVPGLYCVGQPTPESPVLVTANYKLSFDALRRELAALDAWILVVDTRGINVWCAAGKKTFSTEEVVLQVKRARLLEIVSHRELVLPQLSATGVAAHKLKGQCGFQGVFGPIYAADLPRFLENNRQADEAMRAIRFTLPERVVLIPVEITLIWKMFLLVIVVTFIISGIGPDIYSLSMAGRRGLVMMKATLLAVFTGAVVAPLILAWLPGRQFWVKGLLSGGIGWFGVFFWAGFGSGISEQAALFAWVTAISSYMAMNFTGATPFTSLSGVKHEMRRGLAFQGVGVIVALLLWVIGPFVA